MALTSRARSYTADFALQPLESRLFLSGGAAPVVALRPPEAGALAAVAALAPADLLSKAARQNLLDHWSGENRASLQAKLNANQLGAFDAALLEYMQKRPGQTFVFKQSDVAGIVSFINENLPTGATIRRADHLVAHRFPEQGNSSEYAIQLPAGEINWNRQPPSTSNPEFLQSLNRQEFWLDLAQAYRFTRNAKYIKELIAQLSSWSQQNPAVADPSSWSPDAKQWNLLDTSVRAHTWVWVHQTVLNSSGWTPAANTLLLAKLWEHGDHLRRVRAYSLASNRTLIHASALMHIAQLMHEFTDSPGWETYGRKLLFGAMDAQFHPDGGHIEQSPNYAVNGINDLLEAYWLDTRKGDASNWLPERVRRLTNAMETHVQLLSPNGAMAALSDTYRSTSAQMLTKARTILGTDRWPAALPRQRDVWLFGGDAMEPLIDREVSPPLGDRGKSFGMADSGYYVMRSGSSANARQLTFDAGPKGGLHGHFDLLNFELFGYGKPLIADPGVYKYDDSPQRRYVVSTPAHNTLSIDGENQQALEGTDNPGFVVDQWTNAIDHAQVAAHHHAYGHLPGRPVVGRNIWYDYDNVALIVDWAEATASHDYTVSFNLPGDESDVSGVLADGSINTKYRSGNVKVAPLLRAGQTSDRGPLRFVSNHPPPNASDPAYRFTVTGSGPFQVFATLLTTYSGATPPNITAQWVTTDPQPGQPVVLRLTKDGVSQDITFAPPTPTPPRHLSSRTGAANDTAFDSSGRLHLAYFDRVTRNLKYTVRDTRGNWSPLQTIDPTLNAGEYVSLALDAHGVPGVAYFDGNHGDLKYARLVTTDVWEVHWVDWTGQVGLYPSLIYSRTNDPIISYYHRTNGDLRLATAAGDSWRRTTVDSAGDVGRWTSVQLDPNAPDASDVVIAYADSTRAAFKYSAAFQGGWKTLTIDDPRGSETGGYVSLQFQPTRTARGRFEPAVSYYDANETSVKFATYDGVDWTLRTVAADGNVGLYTNLIYDEGKRANVLFYNKSGNHSYRATLTTGNRWLISPLSVGGREMSVARHGSGTLAYTTLDERGPLLEVGLLES
ncbi:MAG TPA: alginate lyase family protein [Tepidisphaeraceae bacterium]|nr:alginate lyase family protein [Tepidisphaeraceae bacterium]